MNIKETVSVWHKYMRLVKPIFDNCSFGLRKFEHTFYKPNIFTIVSSGAKSRFKDNLERIKQTNLKFELHHFQRSILRRFIKSTETQKPIVVSWHGI